MVNISVQTIVILLLVAFIVGMVVGVSMARPHMS